MSTRIPEHADFQVIFSNITKDGTALDFSTVQGWIFLLAKGQLNDGSNPLIYKASTGVFTSGHFVVNTGTRTVIVQVYRGEVSAASGGGDGKYYAEIVADTSGVHTRHSPKQFTIEKNIPLGP